MMISIRNHNIDLWTERKIDEEWIKIDWSKKNQ